MAFLDGKNSKTSLAAITTGFESLASIIANETVRKIAIIVSPALALVLSVLFKNLIKHIECERGLKTYKTMVIDFEKDLLDPNLTGTQRDHLLQEISKCKSDINTIKKDSIKIVID